jgi:hypothetical protein
MVFYRWGKEIVITNGANPWVFSEILILCGTSFPHTASATQILRTQGRPQLPVTRCGRSARLKQAAPTGPIVHAPTMALSPATPLPVGGEAGGFSPVPELTSGADKNLN